MAKKDIAAGHRMLSQFPIPAMQSAPTFISQNGYTCPVDHRNGIAQFAFKTEKTGFEYIESIPSLANDFHTSMGHTMGARHIGQILNRAMTDKPWFVDIGAGINLNILAFKRKYPHEGRIIWEDLPGLTKRILRS
ncbi:o-methyltransferase [Penicillium hetheringtonii]|uniref:O-methyltransferase n=1 Tax=Penicillium hetheringtonii TaxID=911720 RepID=A0AAD6DKJ4_9EURO|nr:o-methyltransferase [Penicillium hetheringtonii]